VCLRRWWPRWREALVLVQPATVGRWHREGFRGCWRRSRRRPGRPRIDSQLRSLIGRMATENCLWGAPRIHGELLKLGFAVSERTVSRYMPDRRKAPSQSWRTFLANEFSQLALSSTVRSSDEPAITMSPAPVSALPSSSAFTRRAVGPSAGRGGFVDWPPSLRRPALGRYLAQDHAHHHHTAHLPLTRPAGSWALSNTWTELARMESTLHRSGTGLERRVHERLEPVGSLDTPSPSATSTPIT
jgi:hypothetical protein